MSIPPLRATDAEWGDGRNKMTINSGAVASYH